VGAPSLVAAPDNSDSWFRGDFLDIYSVAWIRPAMVITRDPLAVPAVAIETNVLVATDDSRLLCLDIQSGIARWEAELPASQLMLPVAGQQSAIAYSPLSNLCVCFDVQTGMRRWEYRIRPLLGHISIQDGLVVIATEGSRVTALDEITGDELWTITTGLGNTNAAKSNVRCVYTVTSSGMVVALSARDGIACWSVDIREPTDHPLLIRGDELFITTKTDVIAISAIDGHPLWRKPISTLPSGFNDFIPWESSNPLYCPVLLPYGDKTMAILGRPRPYFGIELLDDKTGACMLAGQFRSHPQSAGILGRYLFYDSGRVTLNAFDCKTGRDLSQRPIGGALTIIATFRDTLIVSVDGHGIAALRPDFKKLGTMHGLFGNVSLPPNMMPLLFSVLLVSLLVIIAGLSGKSTVPPTHVTTGRLWALGVSMLIVYVLLTYHAHIVHFLMVNQRPSGLRLVTIVIFLSPLLAFIFECLIRPAISTIIVRHTGDSLDSQISVDWAELKAVLIRVTDEMSLTARYDLVIHPGGSVTPHVMYGGLCRPLLVLPAGLPELAKAACSQHPHLAPDLLRFTFAHELAHVRNRDLIIGPVLSALKALYFLICCETIVFLVARHVDADLAILLKPLTVFLIISSIILAFLAYQLRTARESIADATAVLFVPPETIEQLNVPGKSGKSPFDTYLFMMGLRNKGGSRSFGFNAGQYLLDWQLNMTHWLRQNKIRLDNIRAKKYIFPALPVCMGTALVAGCTATLIEHGTRLAKLASFQMYTIGHWQSLSNGWLNAMNSWNGINSSFWAGCLAFCSPALAGLAVAVIILLPLRDSNISLFHMDLRDWGYLGLVLIVSLFAFSFTSDMAGALIRSGFPSFVALRVDGFSFSSSIILVSALMVVMIGLRWSELFQDASKLLLGIVAQLIVAVASMLAIFLIFDQLPIDTRILFVIFAAIFIGMVNNLGVERLCGHDRYIRREWLDYKRVLNLRWHVVHSPSSTRNYLWRHLGFSLCTGLMVFGIPILLVSLASAPALMRFDDWFLAHIPSLESQFHSITGQPIEQAVASAKEHWFFFAFLHFMFDYCQPAGMYPSTGLMIIVCSITFVLAVISAFVPLSRNAWAKYDRDTISIPALYELGVMLGVQFIPESTLARYESLVLSRIKKHYPFVNGPEHIPRMRATCDAVRILSAKNLLEQSTKQVMVAWIKRCTSPGGGFGFAPGRLPDTLHTAAGLELLYDIKELGDGEQTLHEGWLLDDMTDRLFRMGRGDSSDQLANTAAAANVLGHTKCYRLSEWKHTYAWFPRLEECWREGPQTIGDTANLLIVVHSLSMSAGVALLELIRRDWLPRHEMLLAQYDPKTNIETIRELITILSILYPDSYRERDSVKQTVDNICHEITKQSGMLTLFVEGLANRLLKLDLFSFAHSNPGRNRD